MAQPSNKWSHSDNISPEKQLHGAIRDGNLREIERLLDAGVSVNCFVDGLTPVACALRNSNPGLAKVLLKHRPDIHQGQRRNPAPTNAYKGMTSTHKPLLLIAAEKGYAEIVDTLIDMGADVNAEDDMCGRSALHEAVLSANEDMVSCLLNHNINVNRVDASSKSPLYVAVEKSRTKIVQMLISNHASVNVPGEEDKLPLHVASNAGSSKLVHVLLDAGGMVNAKDQHEATPLHYAASKGSMEIVQELLHEGAYTNELDDMQLTPLHIACVNGHVDLVKTLIMEGRADPNYAGGTWNQQRLPLRFAVLQGNTQLVRLLVHLGADINHYDAMQHETPLSLAVRSQNEAMVSLLVDLGADVHYINLLTQESILQTACQGEHDSAAGAAIVKYLLSYGVDIYYRSKGEKGTALHVTTANGHLNIMKVFIDCGADLNVTDSHGESPLMAAVKHGNIKVANLLVQHNCSINMKNVRQSTCLHIAIKHQHYKFALKIVAGGAAVNIRNKSGELPLDLLCRNPLELATITGKNQRFRLITLLLIAGAEVTKQPTRTSSGAFCNVKRSGNKQLKQLFTTYDSRTVMPLYRQCMLSVRSHLSEIGQGAVIFRQVEELPVPSVVKKDLMLLSALNPPPPVF